MSPVLLVYGATGYVGEYAVRTAARSGLKVIAAGRNGARLDRLAGELGIERRISDIDDPAALDQALKGVTVVLNCAGPFKYTAAPLVEACLRGGVHYLDITGEIPVYEAVHARDAEAKRRGVMLLPGVGFDVVPTDCLALHLKHRLPTASRLTLAFRGKGPAGLPPGTQRTAIELLPYGVRVRRDGRLMRADNPARTLPVDFGDGPVVADLITWGDIFTGHISTGIPNIEVFLAAPPSFRRQLALARAVAPLARFALVRRLMMKTVTPGPGAELRARTTTSVWGEAADEQGRRVASRLHGPEAGLEWTTMTALGAAEKVMAGVAPPGYQTPATAFGADFVLEGEGVKREDLV
jgi:short subunit dehydrogenase-like uncharacterized protein